MFRFQPEDTINFVPLSRRFNLPAVTEITIKEKVKIELQIENLILGTDLDANIHLDCIGFGQH